MAGLPEGFTIDQPQAGDTGVSPGLPPGFTIDEPGANLPDVGPPAINLGNEQTPPLLAPQVNDYVNQKLAPSAYNFVQGTIAPVLHPIDTATNAVNLGLGVLEKLGLPTEGHEQYADAVGQFFKDRYGSLDAVKQTAINDPVGFAADAASVFTGGEAALGRLGLIKKAARVEAPTTEALFDAADANYRKMKSFGVEVHSPVMEKVHSDIMTELEDEGYRNYLAPKTWKATEELLNPIGYNHTIGDIEGVRRALNKAANDPAERDAARRAISHIDNTLANLQPSQVAVNPQFAGQIAQEALQARGNYAAAKRSERIDDQLTKAVDRAGSTGSGANVQNAMRQNIRAILDDPKKRRGYSADEIARMRTVVRGDSVTNTARMLGKLAPTGVVSGIPSLAGYMAHGWTGAAVPAAIGIGAKKLAESRTARDINQLSQAVRTRSPLAAANPPTPPGVPPLSAFLAPWQANRLLGASQPQNPYQ
jgi:hypothetical protein